MSISKRKILAVTGARSDYDLLTPIYERLSKDERFEFSILVTGSHLSDTFGKTVQYIERDDYKIEDQIYNLIDTNDKVGRVISIGNQISGIAQTINRVRPDIVLVAGDREEAISTTMTAAFLNTPVAHFFGGDIAKDGNIDNSVRYAASKFAHIHFPSLASHKANLLRLGEDEWRIFAVGNPAIDKLKNEIFINRKNLSAAIGFDIESDQYIILIQHSVINEVEVQGDYIRETLNAIVESGVKCLINYPNSDAGNYAIIEAYEEYARAHSHLFLFKNLERKIYVNLLRNASCLIGNSSSGILEAPTLGLPVVNIGVRQRGREHAENVIFVDNKKEEILAALNKTLSDDDYIKEVKKCVNPYGDGATSEKVVEILASIEINDRLIFKNITY